MKFRVVFILLGLLITSGTVSAQKPTKKQLEQKRIRLQKEIKEIKAILVKSKNEEANLLSSLGDLNQKINTRNKLIDAINDEAEILSLDIISNEQEISVLEARLKELRTAYADMIVQMYKNKNKKSRLMFLLSSKDFTQAYKRMQYIRQYADYQKKQGTEIKINSDRLTMLTDSLRLKENEKRTLLSLHQKEVDSVNKDKISKERLVVKVQAKEQQLTSQIKNKQAEDRKLDREIKSIIAVAIAKSKSKNTTNSSSKGFALTPEDAKLGNSFLANKGKFPWPTSRGIVVRKFGKQKHATMPGITSNPSSIEIATDKNAKARSIFNGKVLSILGDRLTRLKTVMVQHGSYISIYKNLDQVLVKEGESVKTKQDIGLIHTEVTSGKTILTFAIYKDTSRQNPELWIAQR